MSEPKIDPGLVGMVEWATDGLSAMAGSNWESRIAIVVTRSLVRAIIAGAFVVAAAIRARKTP